MGLAARIFTIPGVVTELRFIVPPREDGRGARLANKLPLRLGRETVSAAAENCDVGPADAIERNPSLPLAELVTEADCVSSGNAFTGRSSEPLK
jgi:hypothetical protein